MCSEEFVFTVCDLVPESNQVPYCVPFDPCATAWFRLRVVKVRLLRFSPLTVDILDISSICRRTSRSLRVSRHQGVQLRYAHEQEQLDRRRQPADHGSRYTSAHCRLPKSRIVRSSAQHQHAVVEHYRIRVNQSNASVVRTRLELYCTGVFFRPLFATVELPPFVTDDELAAQG